MTRRLWMVKAVLAAVCVVTVARVVLSQEPDGDHLDHEVDHEYDVTFAEPGSMGMELDERLRVTRFVRVKDQMGLAEATGWIQVGDRLVSVGGKSMEGASLRDAVATIRDTPLPRVLRFHTRAHVNRVAQMQREMAAAVSQLEAKGKLVFTHQDMPQGTYEFVQALFGGPPSCTPLPVVEAQPLHGCSEFVNGDELAGAIVVVERGVCAFSDKAINAQVFGAAGVLVLNDRGPAFRMPSKQYDHDEVFISAVMVAEDVGQQVRHVLEHGLHPIHVQLVVRCVGA